MWFSWVCVKQSKAAGGGGRTKRKAGSGQIGGFGGDQHGQQGEDADDGYHAPSIPETGPRPLIDKPDAGH